MADDEKSDFVLRLRCPDRPGILAALAPTLHQAGCDIRESGIYGDPETKKFFVRMVLRNTAKSFNELRQALGPTADAVSEAWGLRPATEKPAILIAVSKFDHCLRDIVHKWKIGALPIEIVGVVSNHPDLREFVEWSGLEYHYLPITRETKPEQEARFAEIIDRSGADLTVLARYMQILSDEFAAKLSGKCINIHHSFLPSFKGAKPYHQAHIRGVKLIGATAHYVTADLDEGPIIEQDVRRVSHATTARQMIEIGREVEASVLSRAIKWNSEGRVFLNGARTVVI
nr:formyltetrahydrofolate deformylase [Hyphomonas sp. Mor2]